MQDLADDVDVGGRRLLRRNPHRAPVARLLQRLPQQHRHVHGLRAADLHERAFADQFLDDFFGDFAFRDARIEQHDADVEQLFFGNRVGCLAERHRVRDDDFRARAGSDSATSNQHQSETDHFFPLVTSVASDEFLVLVIFVPKCGPQKRVVLLRRSFTELTCDAILIVAALDGCHGHGVGSEIPDRGGSFLAATQFAGCGIAAATLGFVSTFSAFSFTRRASRAGVGGSAAALLRNLALLSAHLTVEIAERLVEFLVAALAAASAALVAERIAVGRAVATVAVTTAAATRVGWEVTVAPAAGVVTSGRAATPGRATAGGATAA